MFHRAVVESYSRILEKSSPEQLFVLFLLFIPRSYYTLNYEMHAFHVVHILQRPVHCLHHSTEVGKLTIVHNKYFEVIHFMLGMDSLAFVI